MTHQPTKAQQRGCYDWSAIEGQRPPRKSWVGVKLTALVLASPILAIGFLWVAYCLVKALGVLALIFAAVLA